MPDPEPQPNPTPNPTPDPAPGGGQPNPTPNPAPQNNDELEKLRKENAELRGYKEKVDPVLETLWSDQELLKVATEKHNKRLGIAVDPQPDPNKDKNNPPADPDNRNATINIINSSFEGKVGIDKLPDDKKKEARGLVGIMLKEMLDPKGNKTISQVFDEVSLTKLPWYLERAWDLVNKDNAIAKAKEEGANEVRSQYEEQTGIIGSIAGGSVPIDQITLTPKEKQIAASMGITEEKYLEQKKKIAEMRG